LVPRYIGVAFLLFLYILCAFIQLQLTEQLRTLVYRKLPSYIIESLRLFTLSGNHWRILGTRPEVIAITQEKLLAPLDEFRCKNGEMKITGGPDI